MRRYFYEYDRCIPIVSAVRVVSGGVAVFTAFGILGVVAVLAVCGISFVVDAVASSSVSRGVPARSPSCGGFERVELFDSAESSLGGGLARRPRAVGDARRALRGRAGFLRARHALLGADPPAVGGRFTPAPQRTGLRMPTGSQPGVAYPFENRGQERLGLDHPRHVARFRRRTCPDGVALRRRPRARGREEGFGRGTGGPAWPRGPRRPAESEPGADRPRRRR